VSLAIGYENGVMVPCGDFEIDEPEANLSRNGDTFSFRGVSAPVTKSLRTRKTRGFENQSLKDIANKVAGEHGLSVVGKPPTMQFERVTQRRERDLEFLSRMGESYGCYFTVKGKQLCFDQRRHVHGRDPCWVIAAHSDDYISAALKRASHKTYSKAKASYFEGQKKKNIEVEKQDGKVKNGDTLRIDDRVENQGQADARTASDLERENMKRQTGTIDAPGQPLWLAGQTIMLDGGFGTWAGKYVIKQSRHNITRGGYTTSIEINAV
jgi:uncharacterized protein